MVTLSSLDRFLADLDERKGRLPRCEEVSLIQRRVRKVIKTILMEVRRANSFYMTTLVNSGSFYEGTKVGKPDEFDFFVQLDAFSSTEDIEFHELPCSTVLVIPSKAACKNINFSFPDDVPHYVMYFEWKKNIKTPFFKLFNSKARGFEAYGMKVVQSDEFVKEPTPLLKHGPAYTLLLEWNGGEHYKGLKISVDLTLAVKINSQPKVDLQFESPSGRVIQSLLDGLPYFFAVGSYRDVLTEVHPKIFAESEQQSPGFRPIDFCLRCSQSWLEQVLFSKQFGPDSGQSKCLRLLKVFRDILFPVEEEIEIGETDEIEPLSLGWWISIADWLNHDRKLVSSYILKTLVLFEWQENPEDGLWRGSNLNQRLLSILRKLLARLEEKKLTSFFYKDYNLFHKETQHKEFLDCANIINILLKRLESAVNDLPELYKFDEFLEKIENDFKIICRKKKLTSLLLTGLRHTFSDDAIFQKVFQKFIKKSTRNAGNGNSLDEGNVGFIDLWPEQHFFHIYIQCLLDKIAPRETLVLTDIKAKVIRESLRNVMKPFEDTMHHRMQERDNLPSYDLWSQEHWRIEDSSYKLTSDVPKKLLKFILASFREDIQILYEELLLAPPPLRAEVFPITPLS